MSLCSGRIKSLYSPDCLSKFESSGLPHVVTSKDSKSCWFFSLFSFLLLGQSGNFQVPYLQNPQLSFDLLMFFFAWK